MCLQLIWSHSVASVNACLCLVRKMIIYDQSKTLPHTKYILINLSRRASEIAVLHLRNPNIPSPPHHSVESSTSRRKYSVYVTKLRLCKSRFSGTLILLPISICVYTCVSVWWLKYTKLGLALFACFGGRHVGRWETAVLHLRWPTVKCVTVIRI